MSNRTLFTLLLLYFAAGIVNGANFYAWLQDRKRNVIDELDMTK